MPAASRCHRRRPAWWTVGTALALTLVVVTATTVFLLRPAQTVQDFALARVAPEVHTTQVVTADQADGLHLYLVPHADDADAVGIIELGAGPRRFDLEDRAAVIDEQRRRVARGADAAGDARRRAHARTR